MISLYEMHYTRLLGRIMRHGHERVDRTKVGTKAVFGEMVLANLMEGFPILTLRRLSIKPPAAELAAFLTGSTDLREFEKLGCHWWKPNVKAEVWQKNPNCKGPNDMGKIYGALWRDFNGVNQLQEAVFKIKESPADRRILVSAWDPSLLDSQCLPPCHILFQFFVQDEYLDLIFYMRSVDVYLGLPADMMVYALLLSIVANETGKTSRMVKAFLGDTHLYLNHLEQAEKVIKRTPYPLPKLNLWDGATINNFHPDMVELENYRYNPKLTAEMAV